MGLHKALQAIFLGGWHITSAHRRFTRRIARRMKRRLVRGFTHFIRLSMNMLTIPGAAAGSPNRLFVCSSTAFMMVCMPYCLKDGTADRSFFYSSKAFTTVCMPYCSVASLAVSIIIPLVDGFPNCLGAVWIDTRYVGSSIGLLISSDCR